MAFNSESLITRQPILDRNHEIAFTLLSVETAEQDVVMPFMLRLANIEIPQSVYFVPVAWVEDALLFKKLAKDMVLVMPAEASGEPIAEQAREAGFRIAAMIELGDARDSDGDFSIVRWGSEVSPSINTIYTDIETAPAAEQAKNTAAMYFSGRHFTSESKPIEPGRRIHPDHALILEIITAIQQEAELASIEALFKRDARLAFKLLRYINSPWFGVMSRIESVRHAVSILGYQQLQKWLTLLAITADHNTSHYLMHTAMVRAKFMELVGAKSLGKRDGDNLFVTGMLSMLDRIMGVPMEEILQHANLPEAVSEALIQHEGKYSKFMQLAFACEGQDLPEDASMDDIDVRAVNIAHLEAIEWATQALGLSLA